MSERSEQRRSAAWRMAGIAACGVVVWVSAFAQGLQACRVGFLPW